MATGSKTDVLQLDSIVGEILKANQFDGTLYWTKHWNRKNLGSRCFDVEMRWKCLMVITC